MIFSEKMAKIPQPQRGELWNQYRVLCTALVLNIQAKKENRTVTEEEIAPLQTAAKRANEILQDFGFTPSFFPDQPDFFPRLIQELTAVKNAPSTGDGDV